MAPRPMRQPQHRKPSSRQRHAKPAARRVSVLTGTVVLAVGIFAAVVLLRGGKPGGTGSPLPSPTTPGAHPTASAVAATSGFRTLSGRWLRPDGGYILDIRGVNASGTIEAVYRNPQPIKVSKAVVFQEGATTTVFIELSDVNYPGSTYTLTYDPVSDQLTGVYYQAAIQQRFNVVFRRMK